MPAPSTAAGQTSTAPTPLLSEPRGRRRTTTATWAAAGDPDAGATPGPVGATPGPMSTGPGSRTGPGSGAGPAGAGDPAGDVVRWAVFCCALVPVVLVVYGASLAGAAGTASGLVSMTAACWALLRRSERGLRAEVSHGRRRV
ncbi:hypothetical protein ABT154_14565 [Streptomyces sp. NPDC001728]|uniref:hypothetical protein n=1 Tax=Streptomyces sp. NPDC001728 TaxID=3154396 RepID=UPI003332AF1B